MCEANLADFNLASGKAHDSQTLHSNAQNATAAANDNDPSLLLVMLHATTTVPSERTIVTAAPNRIETSSNYAITQAVKCHQWSNILVPTSKKAPHRSHTCQSHLI